MCPVCQQLTDLDNDYVRTTVRCCHCGARFTSRGIVKRFVKRRAEVGCPIDNKHMHIPRYDGEDQLVLYPLQNANAYMLERYSHDILMSGEVLFIAPEEAGFWNIYNSDLTFDVMVHCDEKSAVAIARDCFLTEIDAREDIFK